MHGLPHSTTPFTRILALDLGKFTSVLCVYDPATHAHPFVSAQTTPRTIHDLLVAHATADPADTLLVIETCDVAGWVHDLAAALGMTIAVANPAHEAWRWTRVKRKTDKDDALKLAKLAVLGQLPTAHMPSPQQRQRRRLVHHRRVLVDRRTAIKNQVRSIFSQQGLQLPPRGKAWTRAGLKQIAEQARPLSACDDVLDLWRGRLCVELHLLAELNEQVAQVDAKLDALGAADDRVRLLQSVPGVGPRLAETVVAHLDDPHRFKTAGQVASYAGLVPKQFESGTIKRSCRITRRGPALLRSMLVEVAWMVYLRNDWARAFVARISRGVPSRKNIAIVALARKLLVTLWAMLRDGTRWREPAAAAAAAAVAAVAAVAIV
ncbi:MAG TPA: IS110 family transposase [Mycobacterium sp.]